MSLILDGTNGVSDIDGTAATPAIRGTDTNTGIFFPAADTIAFSEGGTESMRIDASGNVGIGRTPDQRFQIAAPSAVQSDMFVGSTRTLTLYADATQTIIGAPTAIPMAFRTNDTERMRIDSSGNLLVGTTTASNKFVVSAASGGTAVAQIINTTSSGNVISVSSTINSNGNNTNSAHYQGNTNNVGNWYLFGNGTSSYSSDERLKKNIETTRNGYLEDLCKLRVVKYNWRLDEEGKNKELGLIAQEVEQVFPNLVQDDLNPVSQDDDTIYKQLKQSVLPFMLLKAIQELNAKVDAQAARIAALENPPVESVTNE